MPDRLIRAVLRDDLPDPARNPELFEGVLVRRAMAFGIDAFAILVMCLVGSVLLGVAGILTLGLAWLGYAILVPAMVVLYYGATLGTSGRATIGMRMMDLVLTPTSSRPLDGLMALVHVLLLWGTTTFLTPFVLLVALFTPRRQLLHDLIAGTLMVRKSPMVRHGRTSRRLAPAV